MRASIFLALSILWLGCANDENLGTGESEGLPDPACGNGVVEQGEFCDAGGANNDFVPNACRTDCMPAFCGDAVRDDGEECDLGDANGGAECTDACISLVDETTTSVSTTAMTDTGTASDMSTTAVEDTDSSSSSTTAEDTSTSSSTTENSGMEGMMEGGGNT